MLGFCTWAAQVTETQDSGSPRVVHGVRGATDGSNDEAQEVESGMWDVERPLKRGAGRVRCCWRLTMKLLPAPVGWPRYDRMAEQSKDCTCIKKGKEAG